MNVFIVNKFLKKLSTQKQSYINRVINSCYKSKFTNFVKDSNDLVNADMLL